MIKEIILDDLEKVLNKLKAVDPKNHPKTVQTYLLEFKKDFANKNDDSFRYAIKQFWQKELWDKSLVYFKAIISRYDDDLEHQRALEKRSLGGVPKNVT